MTWWSWLVLGAVLLGAELFAIDAQFYLVFLGLSAALVGLAGLFGVSMSEWAQWTLFAVLALISFFSFAKTSMKKFAAVPKDLATRSQVTPSVWMKTWRRAAKPVRSTAAPTGQFAIPAPPQLSRDHERKSLRSTV